MLTYFSCLLFPITALSNGKIYHNFVKQSIIGHLLADGTLIKYYKDGATYFKFAQSEVHLSNLVHVFSLNAGLGNRTKPEKSKIKILTKVKYINFTILISS